VRPALEHAPDPGRAVRAHSPHSAALPAGADRAGAIVAALAIFFTLTGNTINVFILLPMSILLWFSFIRPAHRRRYRDAIANLPRWQLRPE